MVIGAMPLQPPANQRLGVGDVAVTNIRGQVGWTTLSDGCVKKISNQMFPVLHSSTNCSPVTYNLDETAYDKIIQRASQPEEWREI